MWPHFKVTTILHSIHVSSKISPIKIAPGDKNEILEFPNEHLDSGAQC